MAFLAGVLLRDLDARAGGDLTGSASAAGAGDAAFLVAGDLLRLGEAAGAALALDLEAGAALRRASSKVRNNGG